jgi:hypothetical protein
MKQIHAVNLIQMGLAKATSTGVLATPCYGKNWVILSLPKIKPLYNKVMAHLTKHPYGEYFAIQEIFGEEIAKKLVAVGDIKGMPTGRAN